MLYLISHRINRVLSLINYLQTIDIKLLNELTDRIIIIPLFITKAYKNEPEFTVLEHCS